MSKKRLYTFRIYGRLPLQTTVAISGLTLEEAEAQLDAEMELLQADTAEHWPLVEEVELIEVRDEDYCERDQQS